MLVTNVLLSTNPESPVGNESINSAWQPVHEILLLISALALCVAAWRIFSSLFLERHRGIRPHFAMHGILIHDTPFSLIPL